MYESRALDVRRSLGRNWPWAEDDVDTRQDEDIITAEKAGEGRFAVSYGSV